MWIPPRHTPTLALMELCCMMMRVSSTPTRLESEGIIFKTSCAVSNRFFVEGSSILVFSKVFRGE